MLLPSSQCCATTEVDAIDERIELILDLNRRILLLDELMTAARAKRRLGQDSDLLSVESPRA